MQPCPDFRQDTTRPLPEAHKIVLLIRWSFHALAMISKKRTVVSDQLDLLQIMANLSRTLFISKNILNLTKYLSLLHSDLEQELREGNISAATGNQYQAARGHPHHRKPTISKHYIKDRHERIQRKHRVQKKRPASPDTDDDRSSSSSTRRKTCIHRSYTGRQIDQVFETREFEDPDYNGMVKALILGTPRKLKQSE